MGPARMVAVVCFGIACYLTGREKGRGPRRAEGVAQGLGTATATLAKRGGPEREGVVFDWARDGAKTQCWRAIDETYELRAPEPLRAPAPIDWRDLTIQMRATTELGDEPTVELFDARDPDSPTVFFDPRDIDWSDDA